jgi:hypothetical protein
MLTRALLIWMALLGGAIVNGAVRQAWLIPRVGDRWGHVLSTVTLSVIILVIAALSSGWIGYATRRQALAVGALWVTCTVAFEFLAGHYLFGTPWDRLVADYNLAAGRIWILVLVTTLIAPVVVSHR